MKFNNTQRFILQLKTQNGCITNQNIENIQRKTEYRAKTSSSLKTVSKR